MTTLLENPVPILVVGALAEIVLGVILWWTGRGVYFLAMIGVLLVALAGVGLEWLIMTDRERIEAALNGAAAAMETNPKGAERARMLDEYIAQSARETRTLLTWALNRVEFAEVRITNLEISTDRRTSPPTAKVELNGYTAFKDRKGEFPYERRLVALTMTLHRAERKRWLITDDIIWHDDPR